MMFGFGFGMIFWWIIVITLIVFFTKGIWGGGNDSNNHKSSLTKSALDILKERYANGELTKEQFEEMKRDII